MILDDDLPELIADDVSAMLECGLGADDPDPLHHAYRRAIHTAIALRRMLDDGPGLPSIVAECVRREDELIGTARVLGRCRSAIRTALDELAAGKGFISKQARRNLQDSIE